MDYIRRQYRNAYLDYTYAHTEEERNQALRDMQRLSVLAALQYGFDAADTLRRETR